jgi:peptide-methionine (R)-S-oxide reductase
MVMETKMKRRFFLYTALAGAAAAAAGLPLQAEETFEVTLTEAEWRARLSPEAFAVLREEATERAGSSPLDREKRAGVFQCAGCDLPLFSSDAKYDSGTGWPSFWQPLPDAVRTRPDPGLERQQEAVERLCALVTVMRAEGDFGLIDDLLAQAEDASCQ